MGRGHYWAWRRVIIDKEAPTWEEVTHGSLQKKASEREDSDWDEDTRTPVESQFEDVSTAVETCMDTVEDPLWIHCEKKTLLKLRLD